MSLTRKAPLPRKRAAPRQWRCSHCQQRNPASVKKCPGCKIGHTTRRRSLKARCDNLARELCKLLAKGICRRCGGPGTDWSHRLPRRHFSTRWLMSNCDFLCRKCHQFFTLHPVAFVSWLTELLGGEALSELERLANSPWNRNYPEIIADLERQLKEVR